MVDASMSWTMALVERPSTPGYFFGVYPKYPRFIPNFQSHKHMKLLIPIS
jgi:hypothetical protein